MLEFGYVLKKSVVQWTKIFVECEVPEIGEVQPLVLIVD